MEFFITYFWKTNIFFSMTKKGCKECPGSFRNEKIFFKILLGGIMSEVKHLGDHALPTSNLHDWKKNTSQN